MLETCLVSLCEWMREQRQGEMAKSQTSFPAYKEDVGSMITEGTLHINENELLYNACYAVFTKFNLVRNKVTGEQYLLQQERFNYCFLVGQQHTFLYTDITLVQLFST